MIAFDAPNRSVCTVKREHTNTPIQALTLLNDPEFMEAARVLAQRMQLEAGKTIDHQLNLGFRLLCGRYPDATELNLLTTLFDRAYTKYENNPEATNALLEVGAYPLNPKLDRVQTAALTQVASTIKNFDEAYMKR